MRHRAACARLEAAANQQIAIQIAISVFLHMHKLSPLWLDGDGLQVHLYNYIRGQNTPPNILHTSIHASSHGSTRAPGRR